MNRTVPTLPRNILYMAHGSADGTYPAKERSAIITDVETPGSADSRVRVCVLNPTGIFFSDWLSVQYPGDAGYGKGGTVHWPVIPGR